MKFTERHGRALLNPSPRAGGVTMSHLCRQKSSRAPRASRWRRSGGENEHPCPQGDRSRAGGNACPEPTDSRWALGRENRRRTQRTRRRRRREAQLAQLHSLSSPRRVCEMGRSRRIPPHPQGSGVDATLPAVPSHSPHRSQKGLQAPSPGRLGPVSPGGATAALPSTGCHAANPRDLLGSSPSSRLDCLSMGP